MAFVNDEGRSISFECDALISDLKSDIQEFGAEKEVTVWCRKESGVPRACGGDPIVVFCKVALKRYSPRMRG